MKRELEQITKRIIERSKPTREAYLERIEAAASDRPHRSSLSCGNLAHASAGCSAADKERINGDEGANLGIVTSYNDMLSAHQPLGVYPDRIKKAVFEAGATAQVAGGVPAMCDGVTQGRPGMELSLFSRDVIAMSTAVSLSHDVFDAALYLGVCDKIVPGLVMGALAYGHIPAVFVPAGPMPSGLPNNEKARIRQLYAQGKVGRKELLEAETASYHSPGTCTFYGTANSNQMLMEIMGLHLPGAAFVNPNTDLRDALTEEAARRALQITKLGNDYRPVGKILDEKAFVNGIIGLLATGGSTNHTLHLPAMARAAGIELRWEDFDELSKLVPLLCRVYPNGQADVNHFHAAGGMGFVISDLLKNGLLHPDLQTIHTGGMAAYGTEPYLDNGKLSWRDAPATSHDEEILRPAEKAFSTDGGLRMLSGNLGRSVIKVSAVKPENRVIEAPAAVFTSQEEMMQAFKDGKLHRDVVCVVRFQGAKANGMPELHKLTPPLGVLQDLGYKVALVTDGRMSGASGKVPAAIHVTPEAMMNGPIAKVKDGDIVRLDAETGELILNVTEAELAKRDFATFDNKAEHQTGFGRELFGVFREHVGLAEMGASAVLPGAVEVEVA
ncbi:6-phosphogluconate dehydratase [Thalassospira xiamenensis M-5 = DSM 17429]|uniref:Phosphogluconate dehydratase n=1 Tax=Thalassospira xiamenensis M-5 = DSM 17429 TaxID=1123366 RepID=A0AB72UAR7_9PROT|nr:phosphogluconate dehydratase [Thalassospira xiamenensis]AJD51269.1 phosphogluconate dehydratase [Thalassospira xiamenensis M-5 = DSM 17429]SIT15259.1 6-phosphogluconate dehydratase [Thalassospira xiamenensis M-5 = DSM 17429]